MEKEDYGKIIEDQGYIITYNPPVNGGCQFAALTHHLSGLGILRSPETLRDEIVEYLESNPLDHDGFPLVRTAPGIRNLKLVITFEANCYTCGLNSPHLHILSPWVIHLFPRYGMNYLTRLERVWHVVNLGRGAQVFGERQNNRLKDHL